MELLWTIVITLVGIVVITLPVKLAAAAMGATRTGFGWCFLALIGASVLYSIGLAVPFFGLVVAFVLASLGFTWFLSTTFLRGVGIAVLHVVFSFIITAILSAVFGASIWTHFPRPPF